ncbi:MAG: hypothetical protein WBP29_01165 [Candidatus Zixiibacteriota bacterium]
MNKRITALSIAVMLVLALVLGCTDKEMESQYKLTVSQLAAQADTIKQLRTTVQKKSDSLTTALQLATSADMKGDSLLQAYQRASGHAANLTKELQALKNDCVEMEAGLRTEIQERDSILVAIDAIFSDTNTTLTTVRGQLSNERSRTEWLANLVEKIRPWYKKWKHDATKRNFLQVLFASGKAKTPVTEEPNLDSIRIPMDTTFKMVPADTSEIKDISIGS